MCWSLRGFEKRSGSPMWCEEQQDDACVCLSCFSLSVMHTTKQGSTECADLGCLW